MPCFDYGSTTDQENAELKERCDFLARIACKALTELDKNFTPKEVSKKLNLNIDEVAWWNYHKAADKARIKRENEAKAKKEQLKHKALGKLSREEKEALGLL